MFCVKTMDPALKTRGYCGAELPRIVLMPQSCARRIADVGALLIRC